MITFALEKWADISEEIKPLLSIQWEELALDKDSIALDPDYEMYDRLDTDGVLKITTVRYREILIGWYANIVRYHPHYRTTLFAFNDLYYILPSYRCPRLGLQLFMEMEAHMRSLGVKEMISITKSHLNVSPLFDRLGWRTTGITYTKLIG